MAEEARTYLKQHPELRNMTEQLMSAVLVEKPSDPISFAKEFFAKFEVKRALLIIDVQNDFCEGGSLAVPQGDEVVPVINELRAKFKWDLIARTQDYHPKDHISFASNNEGAKLFELKQLESGQQVMWPDHCVQDSNGALFHKDLVVSDGDVVVHKGTNKMVDSYSGFMDNDKKNKTILEKVLKDAHIGEVYVAGLALDYCAGWTAIDAVNAGFKTYLVEDGCKGIAEDCIKKTTQDMIETGVEIIKASEVKF